MEKRILLAEDHPLFRDALRAAVERLWPEYGIVEADTLEGARHALLQAAFDLVVLDLKLPDTDGVVGLAAMRAEFPQTPVVVVSASEDVTTISNVIAGGAQGFIPKSASLALMSEAFRAIMDGDVWTPSHVELGPPTAEVQAIASLSPAQARLLSCLRRGMSNKQIAYELGVTEATVKAHASATFRKLGVTSRTQAMIFARSMTGSPGERAADHP